MMPLPRYTALLALLLATACASRPAPPEAVPDDPLHRACRSEAQRAPAVTALQGQRNPGNWANERRVGADLRVAELSAFRACLQRNGVALPGGVEAVRPAY